MVKWWNPTTIIKLFSLTSRLNKENQYKMIVGYILNSNFTQWRKLTLRQPASSQGFHFIYPCKTKLHLQIIFFVCVSFNLTDMSKVKERKHDLPCNVDHFSKLVVLYFWRLDCNFGAQDNKRKRDSFPWVDWFFLCLSYHMV